MWTRGYIAPRLGGMKKLVRCWPSLAGSLPCAPSAGAITFGRSTGTSTPRSVRSSPTTTPSCPARSSLLGHADLAVSVPHRVALHRVPAGRRRRSRTTSTCPSTRAPLKEDGTFDPAHQSGPRHVPHSPRLRPPAAEATPTTSRWSPSTRGSRATPARLPTLNQLGQIDLKSKRFTAVGYGDRRETKSGGNEGPLLRRRAPLRHAELQHAHQGVAEARHEPVARRAAARATATRAARTSSAPERTRRTCSSRSR